MAIDVHAHLDDEKLFERADNIISNFSCDNVDLCIVAGYNLDSSKKSVAFSERYDRIYACVGFHPENEAELIAGDMDEIERLARLDKTVAIGEIGLDYHWEPYDKARQRALFEAQIALARKLGVPVVVHQRDCGMDVLSVVRENKDMVFILHCFSESAELLREFLKYKTFISFGGTLTFKNAVKTVAVARETPLDRILTETDSPYLAPQSVRGSVNEPKNVNFVAEKLAEIKNLTKKEIEDAVLENAYRAFPKIKRL